MKTILFPIRNRLIVLIILFTILQVFSTYIFTFQRDLPLIEFLEFLYTSLLIFISVVLPFRFTRWILRKNTESTMIRGWKIGLVVNSLLSGFLLIFTIANYFLQILVYGIESLRENWQITLGVNFIGLLFLLTIGLFSGWIAEKTMGKRNSSTE